MTTTNAFQADYAWGRSELLDYKTPSGRRLQASLHYPAGYEPGRKYPMIVYNYELLSQNVHRYVAPSDREYYNISVFTSHGYFVLQPDIVFTPRKPGPSVIECVTAGVKKVIQMGLVDPKRVGVVGHSMGGYNTSILATRTNGVFAAAVAGAADDRPRQLLRRPPLGLGHRRDRPHRDRARSGWWCRSTRTCRPTSTTPPSSTCTT